jgi:hypothetical protein
MITVGAGLAEAGGLKPADFLELLRSQWAAEASRYFAALERLLEVHGRRPHYWALDAETWMEQSRQCVTAGGSFATADLWPRTAGPEEAALAQRVVRGYGELLLAWSDLRQQANRLARAGANLAHRQ